MKKLLLLPLFALFLVACNQQEEAPLENVNINGQEGIKVDEDAEVIEDIPEDEMIVDDDEVVVPEDEVINNNQ